jgi:hypothetical protein
MWKMLRNFQPTLLGNLASIVQYHFPIFDFSETAYFVPATDCDKIQSFLRIIVFFQSNAVAMMNVRIVGHNDSIWWSWQFNLKISGKGTHFYLPA